MCFFVIIPNADNSNYCGFSAIFWFVHLTDPGSWGVLDLVPGQAGTTPRGGGLVPAFPRAEICTKMRRFRSSCALCAGVHWPRPMPFLAKCLLPTDGGGVGSGPGRGTLECLPRGNPPSPGGVGLALTYSLSSTSGRPWLPGKKNELPSMLADVPHDRCRKSNPKATPLAHQERLLQQMQRLGHSQRAAAGTGGAEQRPKG